MKCPECKAKIDYLEANYQLFVGYDVRLNKHHDGLDESNRDEYDDEELINYNCPSCSEPLFTRYEEALTFMASA